MSVAGYLSGEYVQPTTKEQAEDRQRRMSTALRQVLEGWGGRLIDFNASYNEMRGKIEFTANLELPANKPGPENANDQVTMRQIVNTWGTSYRTYGLSGEKSTFRLEGSFRVE